MTLTDQVVKNIIKRLIKGQDYRIEVVALINAEFLQFAIDFFKKIVDAKLANQDVTIDWYKETEDVKMKIEELQVLLNKVVNQGLSNNFQKYGENLINWLDEIEYELLEIN